ncbi:MAG: 2-oxoacid:acceptor oxidoreductase subunit alpha [Candidatus Heimdallarchaeota archaeon]|nr:2-oxoacid:acceptor oxidoreductase subunit alpha [Candidatus Heimdallarchaeota archaeon]MCK4954633.1 2-oxoacid:acceptor oxidoreductase subunit alpha [Candidatus Heimdallarchaeota archaeon]
MNEKTEIPNVRTGMHYTTGNHAAAEGALAAGCIFFGGYPITPSSEIAEHMSIRLPQIDGHFVQFEDEIASIAGLLGASWGGSKSMTATSGPGYSLMVENIGLGMMTETPCVIVNVQRGGPSTGLPTLVGQQDIMQTKWGSHGDYEPIALCPSSVQECFDLIITAFNFSEQYRLPVTFLMDETLGHMSERLIIPAKEKIKIVNRKKPTVPPEEYLPYKPDKDLVPPMATAGEGYNVMMTGLTHDERGYPVITAEAQELNVKRINDKIRLNKNKIIKLEEYMLEDAEIALISFGSTARATKGAVSRAREKGIKAGLLRLITIWPFPDERIETLADQVKVIMVPEINYGQITREVDRAVHGKTEVKGIFKLGGALHTPEEILNEIERRVK